jgi:hypothetical protein
MATRTSKIGIAGLLAAALTALSPAAPAAAYTPGYASRGTVTPAGVLVVKWGRIDFYLNRPTTQRLAKSRKRGPGACHPPICALGEDVSTSLTALIYHGPGRISSVAGADSTNQVNRTALWDCWV